MPARKDNKPNDLAMVRRFAPFLRPYYVQLVAILLTVILLSVVNICLPLLIKSIIDGAFRERNGRLLLWLLGGVAGVYIARNVLFFASRSWSVRIGEGLAFDLRRTLFEHIQGLGLAFYQKIRPGRLTSRLMGDVSNIQEFFRDSLGTMGADALTVGLLMVVMFVFDWRLAMVSSAVLPLQIIAYYRMRVGMKQTSRAAAEQLSIVHGDLVENFSAAEVVKSFGQENHEAEVFQKSIELTRQAQISQRTVHVRQKIIADLLIGLGYMVVLGYAGLLLINGSVTWLDYSGTFFLFWMCLGLVYPRVAAIISEAGKFQRSLASMERVYEILDVRPTPQETKPLAKLPEIQGEVEFQNVSFSYDGSNKAILDDISFRVPAGETLVIAGPSGCGKSTLVNLMLRMFDPVSGNILIDGTDCRHIQLDVLRRQIGVAFQECFLFNRSILENIRYASPDASIEEIEEAAKKANAHDFIARLRDGYQTIVGEGGAVLSRGEKQRITLTRAILKEPKILILDEATASVDPASERAILKAIEPIMQEKTTLLITHRQEIIASAKYLLRMGEGPALVGARPTYQYLDRS